MSYVLLDIRFQFNPERLVVPDRPEVLEAVYLFSISPALNIANRKRFYYPSPEILSLFLLFFMSLAASSLTSGGKN